MNVYKPQYHKQITAKIQKEKDKNMIKQSGSNQKMNNFLRSSAGKAAPAPAPVPTANAHAGANTQQRPPAKMTMNDFIRSGGR
jgi:hypothetical protein